MRALLWMSGLVVLLAAFVGAGRLWAEDDENKHAAPRTRIAVFNLSYVIKNYHEYKAFQEDLKETIEPFARKDAVLRKKLAKLRAEVEALSHELNNDKEEAEQLQKKNDADALLRQKLEKLCAEAKALSKKSSNGKESAQRLQKKMDALEEQAKQVQREMDDTGGSYKGSGKKPVELLQQKDALEQKAKQLQRELEDNAAESKIKIGVRSDEAMKKLYTDVYEAVTRYAKSHDLDVVLHYNDADNRQEYYSAQHINKKFQSGGLMPMFSTPGLDISKDIADLINFGPREKP